MADEQLSTPPVYYEDLAAIEEDLEQVETEIIRTQYRLSQPIYTRRASVVAKIPHFWALVFEQAPGEIVETIQHEDSRIFAESLTEFSVRRPALDEGAAGSPQDFVVSFTFAPNDYFRDEKLEKRFWHRYTSDGRPALVSEPVRIRWKDGKDPTEGLTDGAADLFDARRKTGNMRDRGLPEYTALKKKVEHWSGANTSFFTWFGWISSRRWISEKESIAAFEKKVQQRSKRAAARANGANHATTDEEEADEEEEEEEDGDDDDDSEVEVHESGEEIALSLADELWPNASRLFTEAQEIEELSDAGFEDSDDLDEDDDEGPVDIRALVGKGGASHQDGPPAKKMKK